MRLFNAIVLAFSLVSAWTGTATAQPAPARGGIWQLDEEDPDQPALVFKQGEDVIFYVAGAMQLSCGSHGRAFRNRRATLP